MKKRILTLFLCTTFTLSCLTGCGSRKPEEVSESEPTQASSETSYKAMKSPDYG